MLLALVRRFPGLARAEFYGDNDDVSLLSLMAETPSAFRSGTQLPFWQRLLYSGNISTMFILSPAIVFSSAYVLKKRLFGWSSLGELSSISSFGNKIKLVLN